MVVKKPVKKAPAKKAPAKKAATLKIEASCDAAQLSEAVDCCKKTKCGAPKGSCIYFMGLIGAAIYFIGNAVGFRAGVLAFLKAVVWPVFLVKGLLAYLGM